MDTCVNKLMIKQNSKDNKLYQTQTFTVPEHVESIAIRVEASVKAWLTCMVYDEMNELRAQFMNISTPQPIIIHKEQEKTSPYTIYGNIGAGRWKADIVMIADKVVEENKEWCTVQILYNEIDTEVQSDLCAWQTPGKPIFHLADFHAKNVKENKARWYKGDFHTHTIYTDGKMTREENMVSATKQGLDFFVATDHNIIPTSWFDETDTLVIPGIEVTAPLGHYNILGANKSPFCNHRMIDMLSEEGMNKIIHDDYGDALVSINHPFLTEWKWLFKETPLASVHCLEICNDPTYSANEKATELALVAWTILLNDGHTITGIGGSDSHLKPTETYEGSDKPSLIGDPGTFVYCDHLSTEQVLLHVKQGNVTVSRGERIDFQFNDLLPGSNSDGRNGTIKAFVKTNEAVYFEWIVNGEIVKRDDAKESSYTFDFTNDDAYKWIRVDVRYEDGRFYGFTNPIYFGKKQPELKTWGELLTKMEERAND